MGKIRVFVVLFFVFASVGSSLARTSLGRNVVNVQYGMIPGNYGLFTMNYERILERNNRKANNTVSIRFGGGKHVFGDEQGPAALAGVNFISGKFKDHHLEGGLGLSALHDMKGYNDVQKQIEQKGVESLDAGTNTDRASYITPLPYAYFGYRYMKPTGKVVFKVGVGIPEAVTFGIGLKM